MKINIPRDIKNELIAAAKDYPVVTITGPRQAGKTTLVRETFPGMPRVSLEDLDERDFATSDPRGFLARFPEGAIFDEIQRVPTLLSYIQTLVDEIQKPGMFILTGSHQVELSAAITQSLAGRTALLKLLPLSFNELSTLNLQLSLDEYMLNGMYPRLYDNNLNPTKYYSSYVQTYVERDVRKMINVKDLNLFQKFMKICAGRVAQIFNSNSISNEVGVSHHTIQEWVSVLEASFLTVRLEPYFENFGKRVIKSPKLYFTDVGLVAYLLGINNVTQIQRDPLRGNLFENMVIMDFYKNRYNFGFEPGFYFHHESNEREIDLLFKISNKLIPIEIKSAQTFNFEFFKNVNYLQKLLPERAPFGFVVYGGTQEQWIDTTRVVNYHHILDVIRYAEENV